MDNNSRTGQEKPPTYRLLLVIIALLIGVIAGIGAGVLFYNGNLRDAVLYGFGVFGLATLFVITIESRLFD
jgi:hypothetical protein